MPKPIFYLRACCVPYVGDGVTHVFVENGALDNAEVALSGGVRSSLRYGGAGGTRTPYLFNAIEALSQLSYSPVEPYFSKCGLGLQPAHSAVD